MTVSCVTRERERDDRGWVEIDISKKCAHNNTNGVIKCIIKTINT